MHVTFYNCWRRKLIMKRGKMRMKETPDVFPSCVLFSQKLQDEEKGRDRESLAIRTTIRTAIRTAKNSSSLNCSFQRMTRVLWWMKAFQSLFSLEIVGEEVGKDGLERRCCFSVESWTRKLSLGAGKAFPSKNGVMEDFLDLLLSLSLSSVMWETGFL